MKFVLYSLNYAPELTGIGKYSGELANWLAENGHEVRVICSPPYYPEWRIAEAYRGWRYRYEKSRNLEVFRCPLYVPRCPTTLSRLFHLVSFAITSLPIVLKQWQWKPDVIMVVEPTFFCVPATLLLSKTTKSKSLLHIQDFELDAMIGLGMAKHGKRATVCYSIESFLMRQFSAISSISYSILKKAGNKTRHKIPLYFLPNWVDTDFIAPMADKTTFRERWGISETSQVVLYSGNLGKKQGLDMLIQAAQIMKDDQDVVFFILGHGVEKKFLSEQAKKLNLKNIRFEPLQPYRDLPSLMAIADVHLVIQKKGVDSAMLPSKLSTILSAGGHVLITAEPETELGLLCKQFPGIAQRVEPENVKQFVSTLRKMLLEAKATGAGVNKVGREYAVAQLNKEKVLHSFNSLLQSLADTDADTDVSTSL